MSLSKSCRLVETINSRERARCLRLFPSLLSCRFCVCRHRRESGHFVSIFGSRPAYMYDYSEQTVENRRNGLLPGRQRLWLHQLHLSRSVRRRTLQLRPDRHNTLSQVRVFLSRKRAMRQKTQKCNASGLARLHGSSYLEPLICRTLRLWRGRSLHTKATCASSPGRPRISLSGKHVSIHATFVALARTLAAPASEQDGPVEAVRSRGDLLFTRL